MKQGLFLTHAALKIPAPPPTWDKSLPMNSYDTPFLPHEGLLTLKKNFSRHAGEEVILRVAALGIFELYLNGKRLLAPDGKRDYFRPGWLDYRFRTAEYTFDLTQLCQEENLLVAQVAPGWYASRISYGIYGYRKMALAAELELSAPDGTVRLLPSDLSWDAALCGPVLRSDLWDGEYVDATLPKPWEEPERIRWEKAVLGDHTPAELFPPLGEPIRIREDLTLSPVSAVTYEITPDVQAIAVKRRAVGQGCETVTLNKGEGLILDFAQELAGIPRLRLKAKKGTRVELFFAELLNDSGDPARGNDGPAGSLYLANYRSALSRMVFITPDGETEISPDFCFFGFRYLEIRPDAEVELLAVKAEVISSIPEETGDFSCSDPEVNRLYQNALWGMRANYLSVPTDCPQRDERLGWTGDTQIFCPAASYLADIDRFMHKWLRDCRDSQIGFDGGYSNIVPRVFLKAHHGGAAAWTDAGILVPYRLWLMYRDEAILAEHYASMEEYMSYLAKNDPPGPLPTFGDWLAYVPTDSTYISLCYYAHDAALMEKISRILKKEEQEKHYGELKNTLRRQWRERYLKDGRLTEDTQTAHLLALAFELAPDKAVSALKHRLRWLIEENGNKLTTGFVGTGLLAPTLSRLGMDDSAYALLFQTENPGWLYSVRQGATTMWERWNSYTAETGFGDVSMNSFNHYAYGAVVQWFFEGICGIRPNEEEGGFSSFTLAPTPDSPARSPRYLQRARAAYRSRQGTIRSEWAWVKGRLRYRFSIPQGTEAALSLLCPRDSLSVNGLSRTAEELGALRREDRLCFSLPAGSYEILV